MKKVCIVTGVGDATGSAIVRKFASEGYLVAMIARNADRLKRLEKEIAGAKAYPCDLSDLEAFDRTLDDISREMGAASVAVHNAVAHTFDTFMDADPEELEKNFRVNTTAFLHLARSVSPAMVEAGAGAIIATGNTASLRGVPTYALFAPTKAAQRIFAQAIAKELGPKGVHVAYLTIDAAIDVTWLGAREEKPDWLEPPAGWDHPREDFFAKPNAIAAEAYHLAHQDRSAWAFEMTIRPFAEKW